MAYLNHDEREKLLQELTRMKVGAARGKLRRMDPKSRLAYMRNAQETGEYWTRYELDSLGVIVTLVERETETQTADDAAGSAAIRLKPDFELSEVIIDPTPDNHT